MATQRFFPSINHRQVVILSLGFPFPGTFSGVLAITPHFTTCFLLHKKAANDAGTACSCTYASIFAAMKNAWAERRYAHSAYRDRRVRQSAAHFRALLHIATTRHLEDLSRKASVLINGILLTFQYELPPRKRHFTWLQANSASDCWQVFENLRDNGHMLTTVGDVWVLNKSSIIG